jgi:hypothetical protein
MKAASILVNRATLQRQFISSSEDVPPKNVLLFLYLSKLVMGIGQLQQNNL